MIRKTISTLFVVTGVLQLTGIRPVRRAYVRWGYPEWFRVAIGMVEIEAGLLAAFGNTQRVAALQLIPIMVGAIYTHGKIPGERHMIVVPAFMLLALVPMAQLRDQSGGS